MKKRLVHGMGINDADYCIAREIKVLVDGVYKNKQVDRCPYYFRWKSMLQRVYSKGGKGVIGYENTSVTKEWLLFSNFKGWMVLQDWEGMQLDKDILCTGLKIYGPDTCVFVPNVINTFINDQEDKRGEYLLGASLRLNYKGTKLRFKADCHDPFGENSGHISNCSTEEEAHEAWRERKEGYALALVESYPNIDERVKRVLLTKYALT